VLGDRKTRQANIIGNHLGRLYWNGKLALNDRARLLHCFLVNAPPDVTGNFLERIGIWLQEETPAPEVLVRLKELWESRDLVGRREEAAAFSWWFSSGRFEETWALDQFERALSAGGSLGFARQVGEQLLEVLPRHPAKVLACLSRLLTDSERHDWAVLTLHGTARVKLQGALTSGDTHVRREADALVNRLLALGHPEFGDLVPCARKASG
jgi:hypothetical protein